MEYKPLPVGVDSFEKLITRGYYLIDKTLLIQELMDKKGDVNLFTRPRRFGKTLNMSMLRYFFEDERDEKGERQDNAYLFDGLAILQAGEKYLSHMGQYPVISLTLKSAKQPNFELAIWNLADEIIKEYERHAYILNGDTLSGVYQEKNTRIREGKADRAEYSKSLEFLSRCLRQYYKLKRTNPATLTGQQKQVKILLDTESQCFLQRLLCG